MLMCTFGKCTFSENSISDSFLSQFPKTLWMRILQIPQVQEDTYWDFFGDRQMVRDDAETQ